MAVKKIVKKIVKNTAKLDINSRSKYPDSKSPLLHPCHSGEVKRLNRILGQVDGVKKMIHERRYCPEILIQVKAARSALKSLEAAILKTHVEHCIKNAASSKNDVVISSKINELLKLIQGSIT